MFQKLQTPYCQLRMGNGLKLPQMIILYLIYITRYFSTESLTEMADNTAFRTAAFVELTMT